MDVDVGWDTALSAVGIGALLAALVAAGVVVGVVPLPVLSEYDHATVAVHDENGTELGTVRVRIADTVSKRYTGLSDTDSLGPDEGMLFVFDGEAERAFVMREMAFPLDIVFADAAGRITNVAHAPVPPPGTAEDDLTRYRGEAKWVLEVNRNWTVEHGVEVGDELIVES